MKKIIFFIAFLIPVLGFSQDLNNGLVAKFLFNGNLADSSVNQNNLLANGVALYTIDHLGKSNNALSMMDMNGFYLYTENANSAYNFTNQYSIGFWIKNLDGNAFMLGDVLFHGDPFGGAKQYSVSYQDYGFLTAGRSGNNQIGVYDYTHFVFVYDNTTMKVYVNGVLVEQFTVAALTNIGDYPLVIAKFNNLSWQNSYKNSAALDDIYVYNRTLTAGEVALLYGKQITGVDENVNLTEDTLFPNPATGTVLVKGGFKKIEVLDALGNKMKLDFNIDSFNVDDLAAGTYIVRITDLNNNVVVKKLIRK